MLAPTPDSWELVSDAAVEYRGERVYLPEHELEPTAAAPGRVKFYHRALYGHDGRDAEGPSGNTFVLPHRLGPEIHYHYVWGYVLEHFPWSTGSEVDPP